MSTEHVNNASQDSLGGNELYKSVAWYMQILNISSITLITQKATFCCYLHFILLITAL